MLKYDAGADIARAATRVQLFRPRLYATPISTSTCTLVLIFIHFFTLLVPPTFDLSLNILGVV